MAAQYPNVYQRAAQRQAEEAALVQAQQAAAAAEAERTRSRTAGETGRDVALSLSSGIGGLVGAGYGLVNAATGGTLDRATSGGGTQFFQDWQAAMAEGQSPQLQARRENVMGAFQEGVGTGLAEAVSTPSVLVDMAIQSLPYFVPGLGAAGVAARTTQAGALARGATEAAAGLAAGTRATQAALAANAATMGGMGNVDAINEARAAGLSENEVQLAGIGGFAANFLLSAGTNKALGTAALEAGVAQRAVGAGGVGQAGGVAAQVGLGALREGTQEAIEEAGQTAIRNVAGQRDVAEDVGTSAVLGWLLGGTFGAAFGAANVRKPTQTREQIQAVQAELEAELQGLGLSAGDRPLDAMMRARQRAGEVQAQIDANPSIQEALARQQLPEVQYLAPEEIDIGATPLPGAEFDAEEINLGAAVPPGLSGLNRIVAEQRAVQASQPPRMGVQEISFDQFTGATEQDVAGLPQVDEITGRSVRDIIRETAPIERVAQQFGPAVAGAEAARRAATAEVPAAPVQAPDLTTPRARGAFKASIRQAFVDNAGITPRQAQGAQFEAIVDAAVRAGAMPGTPEFDTAVGTEAARRLGQVEAAGGQSDFLGALVNSYPVSEEQRLDAAFDRGGVDTTEEELFGVPPAQATSVQTPQEGPLIPASAVKTGEVGQVWVDRQGQEFRVVQAPNAGRTVLVEDAQGTRRGIPFNRVRAQDWQLRPTPQVAGLSVDVASQLRNLLAGTYWVEQGGRLLRAQGDTGPVVGRTEWLSSIPEVQAVLSNTSYNAEDVQGWLDRAATGQGRPLGDKQVAIIEGLLDVMSQPQVEADVAPRQADAATPKQVTAAAPRYDAQAWAEYMTYPGAAQLNALVEMKTQEGHPQPVLAGMLFGIDLAGDLAELNPLVTAAQAHPEFALMPQGSRSEVSTHVAQAVNRVTGATFELADTVPVRPTELQRALAMSEDEYIAAINPTGATSEASDVVIVRVGDLARPVDAPKVATFADSQGVAVDVYADANGTLYAEQGGEVVGQIESRDGETLNIVAQEAQGRGIGTGLAAELIRREPFAQAGSLSPAGEATRRAAFRRVKAESAKFARGDTVKSMNKRVFDRAIATAQGNLSVPVSGFDTVADLQVATGLALPTNVKGMFYQGNIYLVRENIANGKDMALTLAHELGHSGLSSLLGPSLNAATNRMWANADMRKRVRTKMADLKMAQGTEAERRASRTLAAEEVLADMLASGERLNKDIWSKLRAGVREFFARVFGVRDYVVSNKEVDALLSDVARVINGAAAGQVRNEMANADMWFTAPEAVDDSTPKFAQAKTDLNELMRRAQTESEDKVKHIGHIAKAAADSTAEVGRKARAALSEGSAGTFMRDWFMGLDNIVDWHDKLFTIPGTKKGLLRAVFDEKEAKDATFSRLNAERLVREYTSAKGGVEIKESLPLASVNDVMETWDNFQRANPNRADLLDFVLTDGTYYQVFPDRAWDDQVTEGFDYEAKGYTEEERKAAYERVSAAYKQIGDTGQSIYKNSQAIYAQRFAEYYKSITKEAERRGDQAKESAVAKGGDAEQVAVKVDAAVARYKQAIGQIMGRIKQGPYSPLQRYGNHLLTVRDAQGDVVLFAGFDTRAEADAAASEIEQARAAAGERVVINIGTPKDTTMDATGAARSDIDAIRNEVLSMLPDDMDADLRESATTAITAGLAEVYLQSLPAKSFAKHALGRKNVAGYDRDALRSFANYTIRSARAVANVQFDGRIADAVTEVQTYVKDVAEGKYSDAEGVVRTDTQKLQGIANSVKNQHLAASRVEQNKIVNAATAAAFTFQLTSPSHMFMNATQTLFMSLPRLAGKYGAGRAGKEINRALGEYAKSGFDILNDAVDANGVPKASLRRSADPRDQMLLEVLEQIKADGPLDITQAHDAAGIADGSTTELSPYTSKVMKWLSYFMHKSEVFNRQVTGAAAIRLELANMLQGKAVPTTEAERQALKAELVHAGKEAIRTTQFNYSQFNKARSMQSPTGKLLLQYKTYQFNMLSTIAKDIRDAELGKLVMMKEPINAEEAAIARKTLSWVLGMQLALTGSVGTILAPFVFGLADAFRDDDDLLSSKDEFLVEAAKLGIIGEIASKGLFSQIMDTGRIEAGTLIPLLGQGGYAPVAGTPSETFTYYLTQNLGPAAGLAKNLYGGTADLFNGDVEKAVGKLLPKPGADLWKSTFDSAKGVRDARGVVYFEPNPFDTFMGLAGFRSGDRREAEALRSRLYSATTTMFDVRNRYLQRLAAAQTSGDMAGVNEAIADIQAWSQEHPDMAFRKQEIASAVTKRVKTEYNAAQFGLPTAARITPSMAELVGL